MGDISKNFSRYEFACKCGCGFDTVDIELIQVLEDIRADYGHPITISSGCRCKKHNARVGGNDNSQHLYGRAADFSVEGIPASMVYTKLLAMNPGKYGLGLYPAWVHIDTRTDGGARW